MSVRLCRSEQVKNPYFVSFLGIHLYSSQELAYVIYHYPILVMDQLVDERLLNFLRDELNLGFLALKLENWKRSKENPDETLIFILQESDYYNQNEIAEYRQLVAEYRKKPVHEIKKLRADALFGLRQYGKAVKLYQEILEELEKESETEQDTAGIWNNLGACYGRMFLFEKAAEAFGKAYEQSKNRDCLRSLYWLTRLDSRVTMEERLLHTITEEEKKTWDEKLQDARSQAAKSQSVKQVETWFAEGKEQSEQKVRELIETWKREYRGMI